MSVTFLHPWYALLLVVLPFVWFLGRRLSRIQRSLRCVLLASLIVASMQPVLIHQVAQQHTVVMLDQSDSLSDEAKAQAVVLLKQQLASIQDKANVDVLQLAGTPIAIDGLAVHYFPSAQSSLSQLVSQALSLVPVGSSGNLVLLSDGQATDPHWSRDLTLLKQRGIVLNWIRLSAKPQTPFIANAESDAVRIGSQPALHVSIEGIDNYHQSLSLQVFKADHLIAEKSLVAEQWRGHSSISTSLTLGAVSEEFTAVELRLTTADKQTQFASRQLWLAAQPAYSLLFVGNDPQAERQMQQLLGSGFQVVQAKLPLAADTDFAQYQAVMLDDIGSTALPELTQKRLLTAIENGLGLFYTGGEIAFSKGGMATQPLAQALPVKLQQQEQQREPGVSLAIVIDSSGSMQGRPLELAKQVARLAVRKLKPQDQVGIVEFYGTRQWAVPMQAALHPDDLERAIGRLQAQGGSELFPAIQEAYFGLKNSHNRYRHILLITDAAVEEENYQRLLRFIAQDQINVSTVLVGESTDGEQRMAEIANWGRGRFYAIHNEFNMVEINLHRPATEPQSILRRGDFQLLHTATQTPLPVHLQDYAKVQPQPAAQVIWQETHSGDPLVSSWRYGAGRVSAFMTDPLGSGTQGWQQWPEYGQWLGKQITSLTNMQQHLQLHSERQFNRLQIQLDVAADVRQPTLQWKSQSSESWHNLSLQQRSPTLYHADLDIKNSADVLLQASDGVHLQRAANGASSDIAPEQQVSQQWSMLLSQVVHLSGGVQLDGTLANLPTVSPTLMGLAGLSLYPGLLFAALLLYFVELIYRRWPRALVVSGTRV